jgi:hypothetical protein
VRTNSSGNRGPSPHSAAAQQTSATPTLKKEPSCLSDTAESSSGGYFDVTREAAVARDRLEKLRREKERQDDIRRAEQQKFLDKRLLEVRLREERRAKIAAEEEAKFYAKEEQLVSRNEASERTQFIEREEELERRLMMSAWLRVERQQRLHQKEDKIDADERVLRQRVEKQQRVEFERLRLEYDESHERQGLVAEERVLTDAIVENARTIVAALTHGERVANAFLDEEMRLRHNILRNAAVAAGDIFLSAAEGTVRFRIDYDERKLRHWIEQSHREAMSHGILYTYLWKGRCRLEIAEAVERSLLLCEAEEEHVRGRMHEREVAACLLVRQQFGHGIAQLFRKMQLEHQAALRAVEDQRAAERRLAAESVASLQQELHSARTELSKQLRRLDHLEAQAERKDMGAPPASRVSVATATEEHVWNEGQMASAALSGSPSDSNLVALLCAENQRLQQSNAKLMEHQVRHFRLARGEAGDPATTGSPLLLSSPPPLAKAGTPGTEGGKGTPSPLFNHIGSSRRRAWHEVPGQTSPRAGGTAMNSVSAQRALKLSPHQ